MKKISSYAILIAGLIGTSTAMAHVGTANKTLPISASGQSTFAIAGSTSEIEFIVGHGCAPGETVPDTLANLDTTQLKITVPAAIVTATTAASVRPSHSGEFGNVSRTLNGDGSLTFTWTKAAAVQAADDQLYKVSIRLKTPAVVSATDYSIKKYQFLAVQYCSDSATPLVTNDYVMDWGTANSPTILSFPEKRKGFNQYTLDTSTVGDFTAASGTATLAAKLKSYFGDAQIVWVGKGAYSANANTVTKINTLATTDLTYSNLGTVQGTSLTTETIWVKY